MTVACNGNAIGKLAYTQSQKKICLNIILNMGYLKVVSWGLCDYYNYY